MTNFFLKIFIKDYKNVNNPTVRMSCGKLAGTVGIFCNVFLFLIKFLAGIFTKSVSFIADSLNSLTDAASSIISLIGFKLSSKPADGEHPYGHGRYEYISALSVSVVILLIGLELFKTGVTKIFNPVKPLFSWFSLFVLIISILIKIWLYLFNNNLGKAINSNTLKATAIDSRNDVFITFSVLISLLLNYFFEINIDGYVATIVSLFILSSGFSLIKDTISPLLGNAPDEDFVKYINKKILSYPEVLGTHDLIVHDYGPGRLFASIHVEVAAETDILISHDAIDNIERDFLYEDNLNLIIHLDPIVTKDESVLNLRTFLSEELKKFDPNLSIHDLRIVPGTTHTNIIFDCVVPFDCSHKTPEIREKINEIINSNYKNYYAVVTFESSFS